nr:CPCC family cysteine-rich protein [uncultured Oscillibacter sp.]
MRELEKFPCPCCGYKTFSAPREDAPAYICPVCLWENDVFAPGEDQPSDENRGMTLAEGRKAFRRLGAVRKDLVQYARKPLPEEIP